PTLTLTDPENDDIESATVTINGFVPGDLLTFTNPFPAITAAYNPTTGVLTLSGSATAADYQTVLQSVFFQSTSQNPTDVNNSTFRTISWVANDGNSDSAPAATTFNVIPENDGPANTVPPGPLTVDEDTDLAITGLQVTDVDAGIITIVLSVSHGTIHVRDNVVGGLV